METQDLFLILEVEYEYLINYRYYSLNSLVAWFSNHTRFRLADPHRTCNRGNPDNNLAAEKGIQAFLMAIFKIYMTCFLV